MDKPFPEFIHLLAFAEYVIQQLILPHLQRYDVFRFAQNDITPISRNDAMFAIKSGEVVIICEAIICRWQTSFKKRTFVSGLVDKSSFLFVLYRLNRCHYFSTKS